MLDQRYALIAQPTFETANEKFVLNNLTADWRSMRLYSAGFTGDWMIQFRSAGFTADWMIRFYSAGFVYNDLSYDKNLHLKGDDWIIPWSGLQNLS